LLFIFVFLSGLNAINAGSGFESGSRLATRDQRAFAMFQKWPSLGPFFFFSR
jgi:hypothetical protein